MITAYCVYYVIIAVLVYGTVHHRSEKLAALLCATFWPLFMLYLLWEMCGE